MKRIFYLTVFVLTGCYHYDDQSNVDTLVPLLSLDTALIGEHDLITPQSTMEFYKTRDFSLFWSDSSGVTPAVDSMMYFIQHANQYGLIAKDYHLDELELLISDSTSRHRTAIIDLLLTDSYLALHYHLKHGRLHPKTLERFDLSVKVDREVIASLRHPSWNIIRQALDVQEPKIEQYHFLKAALKAFLLSAGNDSLSLTRSRIMALNMERWRWEEQVPDRYVSVNIPAYVLRVIEKDSLWLQSDVIVGKASTPTPVLESVIRSFIIYPYWHAPHSIATKEILPVLKPILLTSEETTLKYLTVRDRLLMRPRFSGTLSVPNIFPSHSGSGKGLRIRWVSSNSIL